MKFLFYLYHISLKIYYKIQGYYLLKKVMKHNNEIFIGGKTRLTSNTILGKNPNFNGMIIKGYGTVSFGNNFHSGSGCLIITSNHNYEGDKIPYDNTNIVKNVTIEDNVWLGDRVIILGGVVIGEGAILQAGAVVIKSIPPCAIAGGNPAQVFKFRNKTHYFKLKFEEKFN